MQQNTLLWEACKNNDGCGGVVSHKRVGCETRHEVHSRSAWSKHRQYVGRQRGAHIPFVFRDSRGTAYRPKFLQSYRQDTKNQMTPSAQECTGNASPHCCGRASEPAAVAAG